MINNEVKNMLMYTLAQHVYLNAIKAGFKPKSTNVAVIDYAMPSSQKQLFIFNLKKKNYYIDCIFLMGKILVITMP